MRFGLFGSATARRGGPDVDSGLGYKQFIEYNIEAESLGYHSTFLVEHHFTGAGQVSASLSLLTWLAAKTRTLRLGTAVLVLPWHNPVLLAEQAATIDLLSGGRLDFGVGKGYRFSEFHGFRIPPEEAQARFDESIAVMTRAWTSRTRFSHAGRFWQFEDILVEPPPAQRPHPPLWVAAGSSASIRRAAERGFNLILDQYASPDQIGERIALYRSVREASGRGFNPMQVAVARQLHVANSKAEAEVALERAARHTQRTVDVSRTPGAPVSGSHVLSYAGTPGGTEAYALYDTPERIAAKLEALRRVGAEYVLLTTLGGTSQLKRFAREIMPGFAGRPPQTEVAAAPSGGA
jgi:alkanesulfonate monooxygenase SsuD/methylene tetrahydromethanopterin reductase-like flavin-dependent oxidoreductase (luciferase family)